MNVVYNSNAALSLPVFQLVVQGASMLTGNVTILNLLSAALSLSLLDDEQVASWLGHAKKRRAKSMIAFLFIAQPSLQISPHLTPSDQITGQTHSLP